LPDSNQVLQAFIINTRQTIRVDTNMADPTEALLQQMQDQIAALQIDLAAPAAATLAATNAAAAATTALAGLPPTFALSPAMANAGAFLDLATSTGAKLLKLGAEPLSRSFDFVDPSDLQVFLDLYKTTLHNEIVREAPRGASFMYAVCCITAPRTFLSFFSPFSFLFTHMALFVFPVIPRMTQVFPFCSLPTPKLYANFLLVPIFVLSYSLMPSIVASVFCIFSTAL
jgi:hypothetical protein